MPGSKTNILVGSAADIAFGASGIATVTAPTVAEVNALTRIECDIVGGGQVTTPRTGNTQDISSLCDTENYEVPTTIVNGRIQIPFFRYLGDGITDVGWDLFDDSAVSLLHRTRSTSVDAVRWTVDDVAGTVRSGVVVARISASTAAQALAQRWSQSPRRTR